MLTQALQSPSREGWRLACAWVWERLRRTGTTQLQRTLCASALRWRSRQMKTLRGPNDERYATLSLEVLFPSPNLLLASSGPCSY